MAGKKRRTEIQIETHEITIIRYGAVKKVGPSEGSNTIEDVRVDSEEDGTNADGSFDQIFERHDPQEPGDDK